MDSVVDYLKRKTAAGTALESVEWTFRSAKSDAYEFSNNVRLA